MDTRQIQSDRFKEIAKNSNFGFFQNYWHVTHLWKLFEKMCKYKMDPTSIVEDTEQTRFHPQTDRRTDGRTDGRTDWPVYIPLSSSLKQGVLQNKLDHICINHDYPTSCFVELKLIFGICNHTYTKSSVPNSSKPKTGGKWTVIWYITLTWLMQTSVGFFVCFFTQSWLGHKNCLWYF